MQERLQSELEEQNNLLKESMDKLEHQENLLRLYRDKLQYIESSKIYRGLLKNKVDKQEPVSYTHLDVYKRQVKIR